MRLDGEKRGFSTGPKVFGMPRSISEANSRQPVWDASAVGPFDNKP